MKLVKYSVFSCYTAGLRFAQVAQQRGHDVHIVCHEDNTFRRLYEQRLPGRVIYFQQIDEPKLLKRLQIAEPDFLVSCVFDRKVPPEHCQLATREAVNIHPSRLPGIRTGDSSFWNLMLEDTSFCLTMHRLTQKWDSGDILHVEEIELAPYETRLSLIRKVEQYMREHASVFQELLEKGGYRASRQEPGPFYPKVRLKELPLLLTEPAGYIDRLIRATNGEASVQVGFKGQTISLIEVRLTGQPSLAPPGTLTVVGKEVFVETATARLQLLVLHMPDYGALSGERFVEICKPKAGDVFEPLANAHMTKMIYERYKSGRAALNPADGTDRS